MTEAVSSPSSYDDGDAWQAMRGGDRAPVGGAIMAASAT